MRMAVKMRRWLKVTGNPLGKSGQMGQGGRIRSAFARIVNTRGSSVDYGRGATPRGASLASLGERDAGAAPSEAKLHRQQLERRLAHARLCLLGAMQQQ